MKWRTAFILMTMILGMVFLPFFVAFLMKKEVYTFTSGAIDTWILFWGSYIGAIIGSIGVYIVAKFQIKKQYEQQIEEVKSESELMYQRDIEGYLLRNKTDKLEEMIHAADEMLMELKGIEKHFPKMIETSFLDTLGQLDMEEEEKEEQYDHLFENITSGNQRCNSLFRRLRTLSSYFPDMKDELNEVETLLQELDREIGILFNVEKGYEYFIQRRDREISFDIPSLPPLFQKLPEFIVYTLKAELSNSLREVKVLAGEHLVLGKE